MAWLTTSTREGGSPTRSRTRCDQIDGLTVRVDLDRRRSPLDVPGLDSTDRLSRPRYVSEHDSARRLDRPSTPSVGSARRRQEGGDPNRGRSLPRQPTAAATPHPRGGPPCAKMITRSRTFGLNFLGFCDFGVVRGSLGVVGAVLLALEAIGGLSPCSGSGSSLEGNRA
jgi:hypothetical protein